MYLEQTQRQLAGEYLRARNRLKSSLDMKAWVGRGSCDFHIVSVLGERLQPCWKMIGKRLAKVRGVRFAVLEAGTLACEAFVLWHTSEFPNGRNKG